MQDKATKLVALCKEHLNFINSVNIPNAEIFELPEKVLQFGTGVLLRGLPDYYIDKANKKGIFNGRVVVVKSTNQNKVDPFAQQDGLYTLCMRGWQNGEKRSSSVLNASISRVIEASSNWKEVLLCAGNKEMQIIISNTTEVGIVLDKEDIIGKDSVPRSFPGKLVSFLYERYKIFAGSPDAGMVIVPTELISDNGTKLKAICLELASINLLGPSFIEWLDKENEFCDSLVDRIVAGKMQASEEIEVSQQLGYSDELMIMSELYGLWAIQTASPKAKEALSFYKADNGVIVTEDIEKYRHLKLFLLNSSHTFTCIIAMMSGFEFVNEAMNNVDFEFLITQLLMRETLPSVINDQVTKEEATIFSQNVLDRFKNPFIQHAWKDISKQMSLKILMRCVPIIKLYVERYNAIPPLMIKGFAAYLLFLRTQKDESGNFISQINDQSIVVTDEKAALLFAHWQQPTIERTIDAILGDNNLWMEDLRTINGLSQSINEAINQLKNGLILKF